jgi:hypothetical protein
MMLVELSYFYRQLCAKEITVEMMKLEKEIPVLLCKIEKNFPPEFFNLMQHLLIHLPYEAKVGSHVQYSLVQLSTRLGQVRTSLDVSQSPLRTHLSLLRCHEGGRLESATTLLLLWSPQI